MAGFIKNAAPDVDAAMIAEQEAPKRSLNRFSLIS
jgi:hypothetical protein